MGELRNLDRKIVELSEIWIVFFQFEFGSCVFESKYRAARAVTCDVIAPWWVSQFISKTYNENISSAATPRGEGFRQLLFEPVPFSCLEQQEIVYQLKEAWCNCEEEEKKKKKSSGLL